LVIFDFIPTTAGISIAFEIIETWSVDPPSAVTIPFMFFESIEASSLVEIFSETIIFGLDKLIFILDLPIKISRSSLEISIISEARLLIYSSFILLIILAYSSEQYL